MKTEVDWEELRERSLEPGGFGKERVKIWTQLLNITTSEGETKKSPDSTDGSPHHDERQIVLDTDRSFVLYPVDPRCDREALQSGLHDLLVSLFRKRPRLHYFQGYHDIASVIFLTMPEELHLPCIEQLSLHRLRDSMGTGLEPVLGLLRVTKNLLRLADQGYADLLERNSPLPFYALSNLLTLFSHDVPTLALIQHIFDFLLSRPPIATVYLAAAIILCRKQDVLRLEQEGDDGMIHSLLSSLPRLSDESDLSSIANSVTQEQSSVDRFKADGFIFTSEDVAPSLPALPLNPTTLESQEREPSAPTFQKGSPSHSPHEEFGADRVAIPMDASLQLDYEELAASDYNLVASKNNPDTNLESEELCGTAAVPPYVLVESPLASSSINSHNEDSCSSHKAEDESVPILPSRDEGSSSVNGAATPIYLKTDDAESDNPEPLTFITHVADFKSDTEREVAQKGIPRDRSLTDLLKHADALYAEFPPSHEGLHLSSIMGPQSVIFTWSEKVSDLPVDEEAEAMVQHLHLIVYPYVKMEEESSDSGDEKAALTTGLSSRDGKGKGKYRAKSKTRSRTKRLRLLPYSGMEKQTVVAGAVLVVGVAVAIYGIKSHNGSTSDIFRSFADTQGHTNVQVKGWKDVGYWMSDTLATMSGKVIRGFTSGP